jgi:hypothetical protein
VSKASPWLPDKLPELYCRRRGGSPWDFLFRPFPAPADLDLSSSTPSGNSPTSPPLSKGTEALPHRTTSPPAAGLRRAAASSRLPPIPGSSRCARVSRCFSNPRFPSLELAVAGIGRSTSGCYLDRGGGLGEGLRVKRNESLGGFVLILGTVL